MSFKDNITGKQDDQDPELDKVLKDFRLSIHAWNEAIYARPRSAVERAPRRIWRLVTEWTLGCVLVAGGVFGGMYGHLHRQQSVGWERHPQEMGSQEARAVKPEQPAVAQGVQQTHREEEDLLAKVDSDVSRQVPAAMEPLAQLMAGDETQ
jgi:hypothetical protein